MQTKAKTARPGAERKRPDRRPTKQAQPKKAGPQTAQQTIPYRELFKDGICRVNDRFYTKSLEYEDINYQLAQADDQSAIFDGYCAFLNSFDSSLPFQLSFINHRSRPDSKYKLNIPMRDDEYSEMRGEYVEMLEGQIAKSNNGIVRTKLLTFGVSADSLAIAKPRLERVEADITGNFKKLGVQSRPLNGLERLEILHGQLHPGGTEPFSFTWDMIPKTGMGTKDFERANGVRVLLGETEETSGEVAELSCNLDDMTPEALGFVQEILFAAGALEVYTIPIGMKKSRPGTLLTCMCRCNDKEKMVSLLFKHTTTLGIRESISKRYTLTRTIKEHETPYGVVREKVSEGYGVVRGKLEYEDLAKIAREQGMSLEDAKKLIGK